MKRLSKANGLLCWHFLPADGFTARGDGLSRAEGNAVAMNEQRYALFVYPSGVVGWWTFRTISLAYRGITKPVPLSLPNHRAKWTGEILDEGEMVKRGFFEEESEVSNG